MLSMSENPSTTMLMALEWNVAHMWGIRTLWLLEGNLYGQNRRGFHALIKGFWGGVLLFTIGKSSAVEDLNKPEIHNFFWKSQVYGSKYSTHQEWHQFPSQSSLQISLRDLCL